MHPTHLLFRCLGFVGPWKRPKSHIGNHLLLLAISASLPWTAHAADSLPSYTLHSSRTVGSVDHVQTAMDMGGDLKLPSANPKDGGPVRRVKTSAQATLNYDERTLEYTSTDAGPLRSIRCYQKVAATLRPENDIKQRTLRDQRMTIGVLIEPPRATFYSPAGPLTRDELDLVDLFGNSLLLDRLLPEKAVAVGERWKHSPNLAGALLGLDVVAQSDLQSTLVSVAQGVARMEISGHVEGTLEGASGSIDVKAKYRFQLDTGRITWFGILVKVDNSIGPAGPGLEGTARVQMTIAPGADVPGLADAALKDLASKPTPELLQLAYESPAGGWRLLHDRRWFLVQDQKELAVLKLIDKGELLAQCHIASLPNAVPGKTVTLEEFQEDVRKALGEKVKTLQEASQRSNDFGYQVQRVLAEGVEQDIPIRWLYYLLADKRGRQVVFIFAIESRLLPRFAGADEALLAGVRLTDPKLAVQEPAKGQ